MKQSKKIILSLAVAAGIPVSLLGGSLPANAATSFTTVSSAATVSGSSVTATSSVKASTTVSVQNYKICVRDSSGGNRDFPSNGRVTLSKSALGFKSTGKFAPGTYSYSPCVQSQNGSWWNGPAKKFTVKAATSTPAPSPTPAPTPAPSSPVTTAPSAAMPVGDLPGWKQNFKEDFTKPAALGQVGSVYGDSLRGYDGFNDTSGHGTYAPDRVLSVANGKLNYNLHSEGGKHLVAAPTLNDYRGQTYGRYSIRFRTDSIPGYKIAFLLWPSSDQWNEGENDWPEGNLDDGRMRPALAIPGTLTSSGMTFAPGKEMFAKTDSRDWHVATTEWTPSGVKWYWDNDLVASTTEKPSTNFRWTLQAETEIGSRIPADDAKGNIEVDWATSYSYAG